MRRASSLSSHTQPHFPRILQRPIAPEPLTNVSNDTESCRPFRQPARINPNKSCFVAHLFISSNVSDTSWVSLHQFHAQWFRYRGSSSSDRWLLSPDHCQWRAGYIKDFKKEVVKVTQHYLLFQIPQFLNSSTPKYWFITNLFSNSLKFISSMPHWPSSP